MVVQEGNRGTYAAGQMTYASFEKIVLNRPLHQIVIDGRFRNSFVILNRLIVFSLERSEVGDLEEQLIRKSATSSVHSSISVA